MVGGKMPERSELDARATGASSGLSVFAGDVARSWVPRRGDAYSRESKMGKNRLVRWAVYLGTAFLVAVGALTAGTAMAATSETSGSPVVQVDQSTEETAIIAQDDSIWT